MRTRRDDDFKAISVTAWGAAGPTSKFGPKADKKTEKMKKHPQEGQA
jgi:hypothetical protein